MASIEALAMLGADHRTCAINYDALERSQRPINWILTSLRRIKTTFIDIESKIKAKIHNWTRAVVYASQAFSISMFHFTFKQGISSISWKRISSAKVPNKVKRFIWRVAQYNSLPNHKEMSKNCRSCKNTCESSLHTLITCETSQSVWTLSGLKVNLNFPSDVSIKNWLGFHITELEEQEIDLFLCTLWAIWRARKILVHEGRFLSHEEVFKLAKAMVNSFKTTRSIPSCISSPIWIRPPLGYLKINVHATFDERSLSSALGIVVRNDFGQFVIAKTLKKERVENETRAELLALREGAKFAFEYGFERVILEGDLVKTMDLVRSGKPNLSKKGRIVEDIRCYLNGIPHSLFVSCFFSANQVAHILAIWSKYQSKESCVNFVSCPDFIKQSLALDSRLLV